MCGEDPPGMNGGLGGLNSLLQKGSWRGQRVLGRGDWFM